MGLGCLIEDYPDHAAIQAMRKPLTQCADQLGYFRTLASSIRENHKEILTVDDLLGLIKDSVNLQFPECHFELILPNNTDNPDDSLIAGQLESDAMLLPALLNLIQNGIKSNQLNRTNKLTLSVFARDKILDLEIRDFGLGIKQHQDILGEKLVKSDSGLGMAILLSNSTFERLGGSLKLSNHPTQGAIAHVTLPLV